jgi:hypothetical protein
VCPKWELTKLYDIQRRFFLWFLFLKLHLWISRLITFGLIVYLKTISTHTHTHTHTKPTQNYKPWEGTNLQVKAASFPCFTAIHREFTYPMFSNLFKISFLLCWVGIHCDIYKSSYNISNVSYLNSPLQQISFFHLHTGVHRICPIFTLLHHFPISFPLSLVPTSSRTCSTLLFSNFV